MTKIYSSIVRLSLLLLVFANTPHGAVAATSVSNLGNIADGTYNVFDQDNFGNRFGRDVANSFTTGSTALTLESVTLFMGNALANNGGFSLALYSNAGSLPDTNLGVIFTGTSNPANGNYTYTSDAFTLDPATTYWVVASVTHTAPDKSYAWRTSSDLSQTGDPGWSIGTSAVRIVNNGAPAGWTTDTNNAQVFSVQVVPEPSTALFLLGGLGGLLFRRRRSAT